MLPFSAQGANQALEDGSALGYLLKGIDKPAEVTARLTLFDKVRRNRASRVQTLSSISVGREAEVQEKLKRYKDNAESSKLLEPPQYFIMTNSGSDS